MDCFLIMQAFILAILCLVFNPRLNLGATQAWDCACSGSISTYVCCRVQEISVAQSDARARATRSLNIMLGKQL